MTQIDPLSRIVVARGDITLENVDAIVNAANATLRGGGGVDGAIHRAAGPGLLAECIELFPSGCPTGEARITAGHRLLARHVIHAVGPIWQGGSHDEARLLDSCYRRAVELAHEHTLTTLAIPAISAGAYGYPWEEAAEVALTALRSALQRAPTIRLVRMVLFQTELEAVFERRYAQLLRATMRM